jgi:hypothetical protein
VPIKTITINLVALKIIRDLSGSVFLEYKYYKKCLNHVLEEINLATIPPYMSRFE